MSSKIIKASLLLFLSLTVGLGYLLYPHNLKAESSDAIAIRIVENPNHYSSLRWYQSQNFTGSPQSLQIDGYDAIRNNQTAYVNVANIVDSNNDGVLDSLYTNIFIISYTQDLKGVTDDIFGQLIKNLKFNTNIPETGLCSASSDISCLNGNECPVGEYCNSQKAKAIRDVKRLADLVDIKAKLDAYKQKNNSFPRLSSGTYMANRTISTWPSWQETLASALGSNLPVDPLNKLGDCPGFNDVTCWDQNKQSFATDLSQLSFPSGSHFYFYYTNDQGSFSKYCTQIESSYLNLKALNCFDDKQANRPPTINGVSLFGRPKTEFIGYASISDPDGNPLKLTVDLVSPDSATWLTGKWRWTSGLSKFQILPTATYGQKKIYAPYTGNIGLPGYYKVRLTVDDGQGAANSIFSQIYDITLNPVPAFLDKVSQTSVIGNAGSVMTSGTDLNGDPINLVNFKSATFNGVSMTQTELQNSGFTISGMSLLEQFKPAQRTGVYTVNVTALKSNMLTDMVESNFSYTITNNPPVFNKLTATFSNNTTQVCTGPDRCSIAIDNGEQAKVAIAASDPDGHAVIYSLMDNLGGSLTINPSSGVISGFEKLNYQQLTDNNYDVVVKISDQYCSNSSEAECSTTYTFNVLVKKYCSLSVPASVLKAEVPQSVLINKTGETLNTGLNLSDCSLVGTSTADVKFVGASHSQVMVLVSDVSKSMDVNITVGSTTLPAISRLKNALIATNTGFFDRVYNIVKNWPSEFFVKIGLVSYNKTVVDSKDLMNLITPGSLSILKNTVSGYATDYETNTLTALNRAEQLLTSVTDPAIEKIVILMSDGIPGIDGYSTTNPYCYDQSPPSCYCGGDYPNCNPYPNCDYAVEYISSCTTCTKYSCECGGTWPNCYPADSCPYSGMIQNGCSASSCYFPPHSTYNNFFQKTIGRLFDIKPAQAITNQTKCTYQGCHQAFPSFSCNSDQYMSCYIQQVLNCDLTTDVDTQARAMKNAGISLYTIYYNTSGTSEPKQKMCNWSSNNGTNCDNNTYSFAGTDIDSMINNVLARIVTKPKDVKVNGYTITDDTPTAITSQNNTEIKGLICGDIKPPVTYTNDGYLEFTNLKINYCPAKLHP